MLKFFFLLHVDDIAYWSAPSTVYAFFINRKKKGKLPQPILYS